ncbi:MAG: dUTP diphosphatase [Spirochaetales bacterium]|nr:dUTP diphosphatase [Spirochaetales bacterium]
MEQIKVICKITEDMLPLYQTEGSSGADIKADVAADIILSPGEKALVPTGLYVQIPWGYEAQVRPRSGLAAKKGVTVLNTPGTIDSDYRGEVKVILINLGKEDVCIKRGDRIAQIVFAPIVRALFIPQSEIETTLRGDGGFGSTGEK